MKHFRVYLTLGLLILLTACAPRTSTSAAPVPDETPAPSPPPVIENFGPLFDLSINGKPIPYQDGVWIYETPRFILASGFGPDAIVVGTPRGPQSISIALQNKTQDRLAVIWDETSFIPSDGASSRVFHVGVRYSEKNEPQAPTVVPPGARIEDEILPSDYTGYSDGANEWVTAPIVSNELAPNEPASFRYYVTLNVGEDIVPLDMVFAKKMPASK